MSYCGFALIANIGVNGSDYFLRDLSRRSIILKCLCQAYFNGAWLFSASSRRVSIYFSRFAHMPGFAAALFFISDYDLFILTVPLYLFSISRRSLNIYFSAFCKRVALSVSGGLIDANIRHYLRETPRGAPRHHAFRASLYTSHHRHQSRRDSVKFYRESNIHGEWQ